jgi:hypothetical protein
MVMVLVGALAAACVRKEEPKEEPAPSSKAAYVVPPEPARSALALNPTASYTIVAVASDKCLQYAGAVEDIGARAEIRTCDGSKAQQFTLQPAPGGYQSIVNAQSKKCLDVAALSTEDGAAVQQWDCNGGANQQWIVADASPDTIRLVARHSGKVLDVAQEKTEDGAQLVQWSWKSSSNQGFKLKLVGPEAGDGPGKGGESKKAGKGKPDKSKPADKGKKSGKPAPAPARQL